MRYAAQKSLASKGRPVLVHITTVPMSLTFLRGQVGYMKGRGFGVVAVSSPGSDLDAFGREEEVPVFSVKMTRRITPLRDLHALWRLVTVLRRVRPTIVHAHTPKAGLLGTIAATFTRVPVRIYHMRGLPLASARGWRRRLLWYSEWLACRLAHQVVCVGYSLRDEARRERICPEAKMAVLGMGSGNGVDAEGRFDPARVSEEARQQARKQYGIPHFAKVVGFVGRIVRDKGIVELAEAWRIIREREPDAHLLMVGPLEPRDPVPVETEVALRGDTRVHLVGMDWNAPPLYANMDVVALPTHREGFPNVPLEAAAMGIPVVATRIPGCVDAVEDGRTGTLVPVANVELLAEAILSYLADPELRGAHGAAGRRRVLRTFRPQFIWEELHNTYVGLIGEVGWPVPSDSEQIRGTA